MPYGLTSSHTNLQAQLPPIPTELSKTFSYFLKWYILVPKTENAQPTNTWGPWVLLIVQIKPGENKTQRCSQSHKILPYNLPAATCPTGVTFLTRYVHFSLLPSWWAFFQAWVRIPLLTPMWRATYNFLLRQRWAFQTWRGSSRSKSRSRHTGKKDNAKWPPGSHPNPITTPPSHFSVNHTKSLSQSNAS